MNPSRSFLRDLWQVLTRRNSFRRLAGLGGFCGTMFLLAALNAGAANTPPTISTFADRATAGDAPLPQSSFFVTDAQSSANSLTVRAHSSNPSLIATQNIVFINGGSQRWVNITPTPGAYGYVTLTFIVTDPDGASASNSFVVSFGPMALHQTAPTALEFTSTAWVDYDHDGDLDLFVMGQHKDTNGLSTAAARWLRNDNGTLTETNSILPGGVQGSCAWGDYDNDGRVDVALCGLMYSPFAFHTKIFRNLGGGAFALSATLTGLASSALAWGDYDNDGDLDLATVGNSIGGGRYAALQRNNGNGTFTTVSVGLPAVGYAAFAWGDLDRDGDLDLILAGTLNSFPQGTLTWLYQNNGNGTFTHTVTPFPGMMWGALALGDYDLDGDLDVAMTGQLTTNGAPGARIYRNEGAMNFSLVASNFTALAQCAAAWGDYDGDGDPDFIFNGESVGYWRQTKLYRNDGSTFLDASPGLMGAYLGSVAWGDYDRDGDLDLMVSGRTNDLNVAVLVYRNRTPPPQPVPIAPAALSVETNGLTATFRWHRAGDAAQPGSRTYNLRIGRTPGGHEIVSAMADGTGLRRVATDGNNGSATNRTLRFTAEGTNYWSVQSVNHAFVGSAFSPEQSFVINNPPELSFLQNLTVPLGVVSTQVQFTVSDFLTQAANLTLTATSTNTNLVANSGLTITGASWNRVLVIQPTPETVGTSLITVTATDDHGGTTNRSFQFTVTNAPPMISGLVATQLMSYLDSSVSVPFLVGDPNSPASTLAVTGVSSNLTLLPNAGLSFSGIGSNRLVTLTPAPGLIGSAGVRLTVNDLQGLTASAILRLVVTNLAPTMTVIPNVLVPPGALLPPVMFTVGDHETAATDLIVTASSSHPGLVPTNNITFSGTGSNRVATLQPVAGVNGAATLQFTVRDALGGTFTRSFQLRFEDFTALNITLPPLSRAAFAWGDFDNDGDPDLLLGGSGPNVPTTRLYRNEGRTNLVDMGLVLPGSFDGSVAWIDQDQDGDVDFFFLGNGPSGAGLGVRSYRNNGGIFAEMFPVPNDSVQGLTLDFADYDHDGDMDLLMGGRTGAIPDTRLFRLHRPTGLYGSYFQLPSVWNRGQAWGDFDADGSPDLLLTGAATQLLHNVNFGAALAPRMLPGPVLTNGSGAWADFDNDGNLDLALCGNYVSNGVTVVATRLLRNDGAGNFVDVNAGLTGLAYGDLAWGDFDNDGRVDLFITGNASATGIAYRTLVYRNDGNGAFTLRATLPQTSTPSTLALADFDGDGRLDVVVSDPNNNGSSTRLYRNNSLTGNALPAAPSAHAASVLRNAVTLSWSPASDANQSGGLSYNLRVGTNSGGSSVMSAMADATGRRLLPRAGNLGPALTRYFTNLPPGNHFWSVQAVDHAFAGSPFATEGVFTITNTLPTISALTNMVLPRNQSVFQPFIVNDFDVALTPLAVTAVSSDTNLLATNNIFLSGTGTNRHVTIYPDGVATGLVTITLTVADAQGGTAAASFELLLTQSAPVISAVQYITTPFNTPTAPAPITVGDPDGPAEEITLTAFSNNTNMVPNANIVFAGSGSNRTMTVTPAFNRYGSVLITVIATDASGASSLGLLFVVSIANSAPMIVSLPTQQVLPGTPSFTVPITIGDWETPAVDLVVSARALGSNVVAGFQFSGTGSNRSLTVTLFTNVLGSDAVQVTVTDVGGATGSSLFQVEIEEFTVMTNTGLINLFQAAAAWGDYDGDGDLDVVLSGLNSNYLSRTVLYRNDGGAFTENINALPSGMPSSVAWADWDNDGDLDLALVNAELGLIYRNDGGGVFTYREVGLPALTLHSLTWADYDGDGRKDLLLMGMTDLQFGFTRLFRNLPGGNFAEVATTFPGLGHGGAAWGDYDGDGRIDVALAGLRNVSYYTNTAALEIFHNDGGGQFTRTASLIPIYSAALAWADLDNDGQLDLGALGSDAAPNELSRPRTLIYRQNQGQFTNLNAGLANAYDGGLAWGDFDNNGFSDLAYAGRGTTLLKLARHQGGGTFANLPQGFNGFYDNALAWGDYDNDGDLDLLAVGADAQVGWATTKLFRNNMAMTNTPPVAPVGLAAILSSENSATFSWSASSDAQTTNAAGLHYNLRLGTTPGGGQIVSPEAHADGRRLVPRLGNSGPQTFFAIEDLPAGNYFWSVQAIDPGFAGSPFATEQSFAITNGRPSISDIANLVLRPGQSSGPLLFTIGDAETPAEGLALSLSSSDPALVSPFMISLGGAGSNRSLVLAPGNSRGGTATITVTAIDAEGATRSDQFNVSVEYFSTVTNLSFAYGAMGAWGDSDYDGDLDLLEAGSGPITEGGGSGPGASLLWRNNNGTNFSRLYAGHPALAYGAMVWGDFYGRGVLDVLLAGLYVYDGAFPARIYANNGNNTFSPNGSALPSFWNGPADAGDFDGDGDLDLVLAGRNGYNGDDLTFIFTRLYRHENGLMQSVPVTLPGVQAGAALWADYDNDGDLDLLLTGATNDVGVTKLFRNEGGTNFVDTQAGLPALAFSAAAWADFDHDGDLDLALSGWDGTNRLALVFRNSAGVFSDMGAGLPGVSSGSLAWGDFNGDGWADLLITGATNGTYLGAISRVYRNDQGTGFTDAQLNLPPVFFSAVAWGDCDRDGDLDLYLAGKGPTNSVARILRNHSAQAVPVRPAPSGLVATVTGRDVELNWSAETNWPAGMNYNLRVGRSSQSGDVMPPHARTNGLRLVARAGNAGPAAHWSLRNLLPGTYYWSVQAINDSLAGSPFAVEGTFIITNTPPVASGQAVTLTEDSSTLVVLTGFDAETPELSFAVTTPPTNGVLSAYPSYLTLIYRPSSNYFGPDSFQFTVSDGLDTSAPALVTLNVLPVQDTTALRLSLSLLPGGDMEMILRGEPLARHIIEASDDLENWTKFATVRASASGSIAFTAPVAGAGHRFYRPRLE